MIILAVLFVALAGFGVYASFTDDEEPPDAGVRRIAGPGYTTHVLDVSSGVAFLLDAQPGDHIRCEDDAPDAIVPPPPGSISTDHVSIEWDGTSLWVECGLA